MPARFSKVLENPVGVETPGIPNNRPYEPRRITQSFSCFDTIYKRVQTREQQENDSSFFFFFFFFRRDLWGFN